VTWKHHYPEGRETIGGVTVHRFRVDAPRSKRRFDRHAERLYGRPHSVLEELEWMRLAGPTASGLLRTLSERRTEFDVIFFFTYEYATTFFGLLVAPERAVLVPTAHDSPAATLDMFRATFHLPRFILYNTPSERAFVEERFANASVPNAIAGVGVESPAAEPDAERFRSRHGVRGEFILHLGRVDESKGCAELFEQFDRYKRAHGGELQLVLVGRAVMPVPSRPDLFSLGFLDDQDKFDALAAAALLVVPSPYESLSMACLEAWQLGRPVLVNGRSAVLRDQVERSGGGWIYEGAEEFAEQLHAALSTPDLRAARGGCGRKFTEKSYSWEAIDARYEEVIRFVASSRPDG
jgi:glycosyltransferase involved in cell wall biosynthesis